jgi:hypothetical protein
MRGLFAFRSLSTCLIPFAASTERKKTAALKLAVPLAALLLWGGFSPGYAQQDKSAMVVQNKPVMHISIMRPSSAAPNASLVRGPLSRTMVQPNLTPVNTGSGIVYTCAPGVAAATCNYLNTTVASYYNDTFTNANADIYIQYGTTSLGESEQYLNFLTYSQYVTAYGSIPSKSAIQTAASSALSTYDATPYSSDYVEVTSALGTALGFTGATGITTSEGACTIGTSGCYNVIITVTNSPDITLYYDNLGGTEPFDAYDFYAVVEHETDEALGTASCISTTDPLTDPCATDTSETGTPSAVDLFRYSSAGNLVLDSSLSTAVGAYFSYNGGSTNGSKGTGGTSKFYNTLANGEDYADYVPSSPNCATNQAIQDAEGCPGADGGLTILNDGGSEINILTAVGYRVPASASACTSPNPNPNPNPAALAEPGDFNGDCKSDILWRNSSTGEDDIWLMNGTALASGADLGDIATSWNIAGVGDFNGDGKADILWRNSVSGEDDIWLMNGTTIASGADLGDIATNWSIAGVGDFNGDGKSDILWRNSSTGEVDIWLMNGTSIASGAWLGDLSTSWVIAGVGDFNGDGKADILWRNSVTGEVDIWLMNGTAIASGADLGDIALSWNIAGVGDFNGDGKSDILWRNSTTGEDDIWLMNGTAIASGADLGDIALNWNIVGVGDFNGDGKSDILWRNSTTGEVDMWLMNGFAIASGADLGDIATSWLIAGP